MEKYSAYRDPGTGIQPFLKPVPPQDSGISVVALKPLMYLLGVARTLLVLVLTLLYVVLVQGVCVLFSPVAPIRLVVSHVLTAVICRLSLLFVGVYWIPVEIVRRKRGRFANNEKWLPKAGDLIVSNWISWLEIAWLAFRFNPIFILPVTDAIEKPESRSSSPLRISPGKKTGTGSAAISLPNQNRSPVKRAEVQGFVEVSLLRIISACGRVPPYGMQRPSIVLTFDQVQQRAKKFGRPLAMFPECTTSNGRGLLRFPNVLKGVPVPVQDFDVFVMCVRIDPPTPLSPTLSLSIPFSAPFINPITHVFSISSSILPHTISIRLLAPSDSPSSSSFTVNEALTGSTKGDGMLTALCSTLIADIGRLKRTDMGWEDKSMFLDFYRGKGGR